MTLIDHNALGASSTPTFGLDRLPIGRSAIIVAIAGTPGIRRRLLEMGLCPGVTISAIRKAPLGDPIEYEVRGYFLSLRAEQAALVVARNPDRT